MIIFLCVICVICVICGLVPSRRWPLAAEELSLADNLGGTGQKQHSVRSDTVVTIADPASPLRRGKGRFRAVLHDEEIVSSPLCFGKRYPEHGNPLMRGGS